MHRELEWPVSKATCLYKKLYMVYSFLYTIIEGTRLDYSNGCVIKFRSMICTEWAHSGHL